MSRPSDIIIKSTTVSIIYLSIRPSSPPPGEKREEFSNIGTELNNPPPPQPSRFHLYRYTFIIIPLLNVPFIQNNTSSRKFAFRSSNVRPTLRNLL